MRAHTAPTSPGPPRVTLPPVDVATVHFTPVLGAVDENRAALVRLAREAAARARVVVLPELGTTGFALEPAEAAAWAEPLPGPTTEALAAVAREAGAVVVAGLCARDPGGALHNAQVVLDADGRLAGRYAKHHLWGADHAWATPGPTPGAVVETAHGRVGLLVCHDIVYPRTVLSVARERPALLAFSTAWVGDPAEPFPSAWLLASVLLEGAPLLAANRGGAERGVAFTDPSAVLVGGRLLARSGGGEGPEVVVAGV